MRAELPELAVVGRGHLLPVRDRMFQLCVGLHRSSHPHAGASTAARAIASGMPAWSHTFSRRRGYCVGATVLREGAFRRVERQAADDGAEGILHAEFVGAERRGEEPLEGRD